MSIHATGLMSGAGGLSLFWQSWRPDGDRPPAAVVVIAHGLGEHSSRYEYVAERLTAAGHVVWALDHRGHGRSQGAREVVDRIDHAVADLDALVLRAATADPGRPVVLIGHSFGGLLAGSYALAHQSRLSGLVLSGPLAQIDAPPPARAAARLLSMTLPRLPLVKLDSALVSRDPAVVAGYRGDPLVHHGMIPARTADEMLRAVIALRSRVGEIAVPALIAYGTADGLCPPSGAVLLAERIGSDDVTVRAYEGLFHEIFNEPERDAVLDEVIAWLATRTADAPVDPQPDQAGTR